MTIDYRGIPSPECPACGEQRFITWIIVNPDDYEIAMYGLNGQCFRCKTKYTIGTPIDSPDFIEMEIEEGENDEY